MKISKAWPFIIYVLFQEAQEKTDEVTAKFLDKEKDPLKYNPQKVVDPRRFQNKKHRSKLVTTSGANPIQTESQDDLEKMPSTATQNIQPVTIDSDDKRKKSKIKKSKKHSRIKGTNK